MRIGDQAAILTLSRLASFGLLLLGPIALARLIPIEEFGRYREFALYAALLQSFAAFSIPESLLYFVPLHPESPWRIVRQTIVLTAACSVAVAAGLVVADTLAGGALVGPYLVPLALYALCLVNFDFWEFLLISMKRPKAVMLYTAARLASRMLVAVGAAALTRSVSVIIWSLVVLEAVRLVTSILVWRALDRAAQEPAIESGLRRQMRFCLPMGASMLLALGRRNLATLVVARLLGPAALARFTIGKYAEPIITTVRNSLSSVILPEMVRREGGPDSLLLWKRGVAMCALMLFPVVPLALRYAEPALTLLFGEPYRNAAIVMQLYMLVVIRECFDFSPALRARGKTSPLAYGTSAGLVAAAVVLYPLVTRFGIAGGMVSFVIGSYVEAAWLAATVMSSYGISIRTLLPWGSLARITLSAVLASLLIVDSFWTDTLGPAGIVAAGACYFAAYVLLVRLLAVPESDVLFDWMKKLRRVPARASK